MIAVDDLRSVALNVPCPHTHTRTSASKKRTTPLLSLSLSLYSPSSSSTATGDGLLQNAPGQLLESIQINVFNPYGRRLNENMYV